MEGDKLWTINMGLPCLRYTLEANQSLGREEAEDVDDDI